MDGKIPTTPDNSQSKGTPLSASRSAGARPRDIFSGLPLFTPWRKRTFEDISSDDEEPSPSESSSSGDLSSEPPSSGDESDGSATSNKRACTLPPANHCSWVLPYMEAAKALSQLLEKKDVSEELIRDAAQQVFLTLMQVEEARKTATQLGGAKQVASGSFLQPEQRMLLWMGGLKLSDVITIAIFQFQHVGAFMGVKLMREMTALLEVCKRQQAALEEGFQRNRETLICRAVQERHLRGRRASSSRDVKRQAQLLASSLMEADNLRIQVLQTLQGMLPPRFLAALVITPMHMMQSCEDPAFDF